MLKHLLISLLVLVGFMLKAQVNLVPNGSFEEYYQVPNAIGQIDLCKNWFNAMTGSSPDYLHELSTYDGIQIPQNLFGSEQAKNGQAYLGFYLYNIYTPRAVEYIECKLNSPLLSKRYCIEFYVSLADSASSYLISNFGVYFSSDSVFVDTTRRLSEFTPQFINTNTTITKEGWTKISGTIITNGGERYMIIGNFNTPENDDTTFISNGGQNWGNLYSYIFIDSVSVTLCDGTGLNQTPASAVHIYPNPATNTVSISLPTNYPNPQLYIYNLTGQLVATKPIQPNQPVPITELNAGMYIFILQSNNTLIGRQRVVVY